MRRKLPNADARWLDRLRTWEARRENSRRAMPEGNAQERRERAEMAAGPRGPRLPKGQGVSGGSAESKTASRACPEPPGRRRGSRHPGAVWVPRRQTGPPSQRVPRPSATSACGERWCTLAQDGEGD